MGSPPFEQHPSIEDCHARPFPPLRVTHPAHFALLKPIGSARRGKPVKCENDRRQAVEVVRALPASGNEETIREVFSDIPKSRQKNVRATLGERPLAEERTADDGRTRRRDRDGQAGPERVARAARA